MNTEAQENKRRIELLKWLVVVTLLLTAVIGNYLYRDYNALIRTLAVMAIIAVAGSVALMTSKGKSAVAFVREARTEIRKVIWPTRQEALHITLIIAAATVIMSLILWGLDSILFYIVSAIISLRF